VKSGEQIRFVLITLGLMATKAVNGHFSDDIVEMCCI